VMGEIDVLRDDLALVSDEQLRAAARGRRELGRAAQRAGRDTRERRPGCLSAAAPSRTDSPAHGHLDARVRAPAGSRRLDGTCRPRRPRSAMPTLAVVPHDADCDRKGRWRGTAVRRDHESRERARASIRYGARVRVDRERRVRCGCDPIPRRRCCSRPTSTRPAWCGCDARVAASSCS
jgi:hypothetical protein